MTSVRVKLSKEWLALLFSIAYIGVCFCFYLFRTLGGNVDSHILSGEMFGMPSQMAKHGLKFLYHGAGMTGWDGQFYYYISNDLLASADTADHIDAPSYRYQRIGLPLLVGLSAKLLGMSWHSPTFYLVVYALLVAAAVFLGAKVLGKFGANPLLILLWSLSVGTQITLFNALPDAAADAFLIIGMYFLVNRQRYFPASIAFAFAALSREAYLVFPLALFASLALQDLMRSRLGDLREPLWRALKRFKVLVWAFVPTALFVAWQIWILSKFHVAPASQAHGILAFPGTSFSKYLALSLQGLHPITTGAFGFLEAGSLLIFATILIVTMGLAIIQIKKNIKTSTWDASTGLAWASIALVVLYSSFGDTVMMHYSGYLKAAGVFLFLIPLLLSKITSRFVRIGLITLLSISVALTNVYNLGVRILPIQASATSSNLDRVTRDVSIPCLTNFATQFEGISVRERDAGLFSNIFGLGDEYRVEFKVVNNTGEDVFSTRGSGSIHISYQLFDSTGSLVGDGIRFAILDPLAQGQSRVMVLPIHVNKFKNIRSIKVSMVQEGCAWFYLRDTSSAWEIKLK